MDHAQFLWTGRCRERAVQERLCHRLKNMAEEFSGCFSDMPAVRYFDTMLKGRILVSPALFKKSLNGLRLADPDAETIQPHPGKTERFILTDEVSAYGMEFHSYTGEFQFSRDDDRISFIFIRSKKYPELEGALARVDDRSSISISQAPLLQSADIFLTVPSLRVRFIFNFWFRELLMWVYQFFIPEMEMWENERLIVPKYFPKTDPGKEADETATLKSVNAVYLSAQRLILFYDKKKADRKKQI
jgi:hypothetical protein